MTSFNLSYFLKGLASKIGTLGVLGLQGINCRGWGEPDSVQRRVVALEEGTV